MTSDVIVIDGEPAITQKEAQLLTELRVNEETLFEEDALLRRFMQRPGVQNGLKRIEEMEAKL